MWGHMSDYGCDWSDMGLGMLLLWVLLIAAVVMLVKCSRGFGDCGRREPEKSALDLLKERYARSEIERDEFEQRRRDLEV